MKSLSNFDDTASANVSAINSESYSSDESNELLQFLIIGGAGFVIFAMSCLCLVIYCHRRDQKKSKLSPYDIANLPKLDDSSQHYPYLPTNPSPTPTAMSHSQFQTPKKSESIFPYKESSKSDSRQPENSENNYGKSNFYDSRSFGSYQ